MSIVSEQNVEIVKMDISDEVQREVQFHDIALENANLACKMMQDENVKLRRPEDYFAEMIKTDKVMNKIKQRLVEKQLRVQSFEEKEHK